MTRKEALQELLVKVKAGECRNDEMQSDSTKRYFQELDKITHKMLLRELSRPIEDPMRPVAGVRYAEFIEYGVTPT